MKQIDFVYKQQNFTLDLIQGALHGADKELRERLIHEIDTLAKRQGYLGGGYLPVPPTRITRPYRDVGQFALCMLHITGADFPNALAAYIPTWTSGGDEETLAGDVPPPPVGMLVCH